MPLISRLMIRLSLVYLLTGVILGALLLLNKAFHFYAPLWGLLPVHIEIMIFGWIIQLTLGVAYWILPRFLEGEIRGSVTLAWLMVTFLNTGILIMLFTHLGFLSDQVGFAGRLFEALSVILFALLHWNRVVSYNK